MQRVVKYYSLLSFMLKNTSLLTQGFNKNKKSQEKFFNHMCAFGAQEEWRNGRRSVSSYLDVEISNDQDRLVNPTPLDCITGYISEDAVGDRALNNMTQKILNLINGSISGYLFVLNHSEWLNIIK